MDRKETQHSASVSGTVINTMLCPIGECKENDGMMRWRGPCCGENARDGKEKCQRPSEIERDIGKF